MFTHLMKNLLPQLRYIKVQGQQGDNWIVKEGLKSGEKIIVDGVVRVTPGSPVKIVSPSEMKKINKSIVNEDNNK